MLTTEQVAFAAQLHASEPMRRFVEDDLSAGRWDHALNLVNRPERPFLFDLISGCLSDDEYYTTLRWVITDSESVRHWSRELRRFLQRRAEPQRMMTAQERASLDAMADVLTVHRGYSGRVRQGWSWTLSAERARWFACRFVREGRRPSVATGRVLKARVLAYLTERNEDEILVRPEDVEISRWVDAACPSKA